MRNLTLWLLSTVMVISSCKREKSNNEEMPVTMLNVSYGTSTRQKMDVYLPAGRSSTATKVIIMIHGGGWNTGDKSDFNEYVDSLKKREPAYAIFNLNYRRANTPDLFPAQEQDIKAAVDFIYNKRSEYLISDKFVLIGASAGAHLALLQGYKYSTPVKPRAIIDFFGPTDLIQLYNNPSNPLVQPLLVAVTGATPASDNTLYSQSSPINFISSESPPTMILHGGTDIIVPSSQSDLLNTRLVSAGVTRQYISYPTEGHGWVGANLTDSFDKILTFLAANVN